MRLDDPEFGSNADVALTVDVLLVLIGGIEVEVFCELAELRLVGPEVGSKAVTDVDGVDVEVLRELAELKLDRPELGSNADVALTKCSPRPRLLAWKDLAAGV